MKWDKVKLDDVCEVIGGTTPKTNIAEYWNGDIVWLSPIDLPEVGSITTVRDSQRKITEEGFKAAGLRLLPPGSLVFSSRASIGKIGIVEVPLTTNQGFTNFIPGNRINVRYLAYTLKNSIPQIEKLGNTTTFKEVSRTAIRNFKIPLPPLHIQEQIADTLDKADSLRRKDQELLQKYDELAQAIFYEMFGDPVIDTRNATYPLSSICQINPSKSELVVHDDIDVSFVPMEDVDEEGNVWPKKVRKYSEVIKGFTYFRNGDVLFAKITPCMENGKGGVVQNLKNGVGFGSTEFHVVRPSKEVSGEFINLLLSLRSVRLKAEKMMTGSAGQKRVPKSFFDSLMLPSIRTSQMVDFSSSYRQIKMMRKKILEQIMYSGNLFQTLLQQYFT